MSRQPLAGAERLLARLLRRAPHRTGPRLANRATGRRVPRSPGSSAARRRSRVGPTTQGRRRWTSATRADGGGAVRARGARPGGRDRGRGGDCRPTRTSAGAANVIPESVQLTVDARTGSGAARPAGVGAGSRAGPVPHPTGRNVGARASCPQGGDRGARPARGRAPVRRGSRRGASGSSGRRGGDALRPQPERRREPLSRGHSSDEDIELAVEVLTGALRRLANAK